MSNIIFSIIPNEWGNRTSGLTATPCNGTGRCNYGGSSEVDKITLVYEQTGRRTGAALPRSYENNVTVSTQTNSTFLTTAQVKFTYEINVPSNTSILQWVARLDDDFEVYLNQTFREEAISVVNIASFLGASTALCTPKDALHVCAVATSNVILAHDANTTTSLKISDFDANSGKSRELSFPFTSQQVQYAIFKRLYSYMGMRSNDQAQLNLIMPSPTSTNLILQFSSNTNNTFTTFLSPLDISWLEMCATNFIQQYITNSGVVSSIIPPTTFTLVANETFALDEWRKEFPVISSYVDGKNATSSQFFFVNLFVAGQYDALLQVDSDFDVAVKTLFQGKGNLLLQSLKQPNQNYYYGLNTTKAKPSFFYYAQSMDLINPASDKKAATSIYEKPSHSTSVRVVWVSFIGICGASLLLTFFMANKLCVSIKKKNKEQLDSEKIYNADISRLEKGIEPLDPLGSDAEQSTAEDEKQPLSPKLQAESPNSNSWSFKDVMRSTSGVKNPRSPKPYKKEMDQDPSLFSRQGSINGNCSIRRRLSNVGLDNLQSLPVMRIDFTGNDCEEEHRA